MDDRVIALSAYQDQEEAAEIFIDLYRAYPRKIRPELSVRNAAHHRHPPALAYAVGNEPERKHADHQRKLRPDACQKFAFWCFHVQQKTVNLHNLFRADSRPNHNQL